MAKAASKQAAILDARIASAGKIKDGFKRPGSQNPRKTSPAGIRRSKSQVKSDSRTATQR